MSNEPRPGRGQLNLNTVLLAVCVGLSGWALKSINDLQGQLAGLVPVVSEHSSSIIGINQVNTSQSIQIDDLSTRLTKLETVESMRKKN